MVKRFSLYGNNRVDCEEVRKKLSLYIDEEVLPEEEQAIEAHLLQCLPCQREMKKLLVIKKLVRTMGRSLEVSLSKRAIPDLWMTKRKMYFRKFALIFLISAVTLASWLVFTYWQGLQEGTILQQEITPVSTLTDFGSQLRRVPDSGLHDHFIRVVEFTLDR